MPWWHYRAKTKFLILILSVIPISVYSGDSTEQRSNTLLTLTFMMWQRDSILSTSFSESRTEIRRCLTEECLLLACLEPDEVVIAEPDDLYLLIELSETTDCPSNAACTVLCTLHIWHSKCLHDIIDYHIISFVFESKFRLSIETLLVICVSGLLIGTQDSGSNSVLSSASNPIHKPLNIYLNTFID